MEISIKLLLPVRAYVKKDSGKAITLENIEIEIPEEEEESIVIAVKAAIKRQLEE